MRAFAKLREILLTHKEFSQKLENLEQKIGRHDDEIKAIFEAIRRLMKPQPIKPKTRMGFHV